MNIHDRVVQSFNKLTPDEATKARIHGRLRAQASSHHHSPLRHSHRRLGIALAITILFCATVFAATQLHKYVNWQGEPVPEPNLYDGLSEKDVSVREQNRSWALRVGDLIPDNTHSEYWIAYRISPDGAVDEKFAVVKTINRRFDTYAAFQAAISAEGVLLMPEKIPEGFSLEKAEVSYTLPHILAPVMLDEQKAADDVLLRRYALPPEKDRYLTMYRLFFVNQQNRSLLITCELHNRSSIPDNLRIEGNSNARSVIIDGMDKALLVGGDVSQPSAEANPATMSVIMRHKSVLSTANDQGTRRWDYIDVMTDIPGAGPLLVHLYSDYRIISYGGLSQDDLLNIAGTFH